MLKGMISQSLKLTECQSLTCSVYSAFQHEASHKVLQASYHCRRKSNCPWNRYRLLECERKVPLHPVKRRWVLSVVRSFYCPRFQCLTFFHFLDIFSQMVYTTLIPNMKAATLKRAFRRLFPHSFPFSILRSDPATNMKSLSKFFNKHHVYLAFKGPAKHCPLAGNSIRDRYCFSTSDVVLELYHFQR